MQGSCISIQNSVSLMFYLSNTGSSNLKCALEARRTT